MIIKTLKMSARK
ncbi:hypothetical protein WN216_000827 [Escherichia coli]|nr:hypothetical protein [Shigella flexneri]EHJ6122823.1 hypothetical protein [Escherichia coli]EHK4580974.1 hypothetical protein [Shigella sonnei]EIH4976571.1 hypothetical protein [Shigella boydii]MCW3770534.1 hypothetical protein [Shigella flexneri 5a str. M90T]QQM51237.1 hypothetical protein JGY96_18515 [Shigella flexneri 3a]HBB9255747.1 hypothetical protein [Shigella flexneri 2a]HBD4379977.1 hypothetical protein [Shigella flexneri 1b]HBD4413348.1 hypothetical protein [Shigella flexneri 3